MNDRVVCGLSKALFDSDLVATRISLAIAEMLWAVMLFWPGDTFDRPTYAGMAALAPEHCWATLFLISSILQIQIVVYEKYHSGLSIGFAVWNSALWVSCVLLVLYSVTPPPAAIGGEIALMVSAIWIALRPLILARGELNASLH